MLLCDKHIDELAKGFDIIKPYNEKNLQPASYDLTLDNEFLINEKIDMATKLLLNPGECVLASTIEEITIPSGMVGRVEGKSSTGRIFLSIHSTAGFIDPGFVGNITLEIKNNGNTPIMLYAGVRIAQIAFEFMDEEPSKLYGDCDNNYQGQCGVRKSKYQLLGGIYQVTDDSVLDYQSTMDRF